MYKRIIQHNKALFLPDTHRENQGVIHHTSRLRRKLSHDHINQCRKNTLFGNFLVTLFLAPLCGNFQELIFQRSKNSLMQQWWPFQWEGISGYVFVCLSVCVSNQIQVLKPKMNHMHNDRIENSKLVALWRAKDPGYTTHRWSWHHCPAGDSLHLGLTMEA